MKLQGWMNRGFVMMKRCVAIATIAILAATGASAGELIVNGGFETGDYTGWTTNVQGGSNGNLQIIANVTGTSPISGSAFLGNPGGGNFFSITDQSGPGSYSLTQSFTLASAQTVRISFQMFANDQSGTIFANGRDYSTSPNQNAVVDILLGTADPFTNAAADIISTLYGPGADTAGNPNPFTSYSTLLSLAAGTYQIRFGETDNQLFFQQGVDNVSVSNAVPEPMSWALMITGLGVVGGAMRRRRSAPETLAA
jgi:hypothetical protein